MIILVLLVLGTAVFLAYRKDSFFEQTDPLTLIPANAILVFETREPVFAWNEFVSQPIWTRISGIPALKEVEQRLLQLDSITGQSGKLDKALKGQQFLLSLHPIGRDDFDFLFAIGFEGDGAGAFLAEIENGLTALSDRKTRNYSGVTLYEYESAAGNTTITYGVYDNILLASFTSFLVEDAIRLVKSTDLENFKDVYAVLFKNQTPVPRSGLLRIGSAGLSKILASATSDTTDPVAKGLNDLSLAANLQFSFEEKKINLSGELLSLSESPLSMQVPAGNHLKKFNDFISNRTALYSHFHLDTGISLHERIQANTEFRNTVLAEIESLLTSRGFFEGLHGEAGFMVFEGFGKQELDKILLFPVSDTDATLAMLEDFSLRFNQSEGETLLKEKHKETPFFSMGIEEFPMHLFGGKFRGFDETVVASLDEFVIFASSSNAMRSFLDDYFNDSVWGKSIYRKAFIESVPESAVFSQFITVSPFYNVMLAALTPSWQSVFQKYAPELQSVDMISAAITADGERAQVHLSMDYQLEPIKKASDVLLTLSKQVVFRHPLAYGPKALENFNDGSKDFLVQDTAMNLHVINSAGEVVFSREFPERITSPVFQLDYFKNGKLQFVFAGRGGIYCFDRIGEPLPNFPIVLPEGREITHFNLVDYDKSRDYRFFVSDELGNLYLFDQLGQLLEGWDSRKTSGSLSVAPAHHRIPGAGDVMVSLHRNGNLEIMNRKGVSKTGSSIRLGESVSTTYGITDGGGSKSQIATINDTGELVKVNFNGELTYRNQLLRPDRETKFIIVPNENRTDFVIVIHEYNKISVLSQDEAPLFSWNVLSEDVYFQWFSFGYQKDVFVVIDRIQEFVYLFNLKGELLNSKPLTGKLPISVSYSVGQNEYLIHAVYSTSLFEYKLPI